MPRTRSRSRTLGSSSSTIRILASRVCPESRMVCNTSSCCLGKTQGGLYGRPSGPGRQADTPHMKRGRRRLLDLAWANRSLRAKGVIVVALPLIALVVAAPLSYLTHHRVDVSDDLVQRSILVER